MHSDLNLQPKYVSPIYFELQLILKNFIFLHTWWPKSILKFFLIFAFRIQICNPNLCKSHIFELQLNWERIFFRIPRRTWLTWNRWNAFWKIARNYIFHRVIFEIVHELTSNQICNPNLCKSHIFWITANIEKWSFFAYLDLLTKINEIEKIARNSIIG